MRHQTQTLLLKNPIMLTVATYFDLISRHLYQLMLMKNENVKMCKYKILFVSLLAMRSPSVLFTILIFVLCFSRMNLFVRIKLH